MTAQTAAFIAPLPAVKQYGRGQPFYPRRVWNRPGAGVAGAVAARQALLGTRGGVLGSPRYRFPRLSRRRTLQFTLGASRDHAFAAVCDGSGRCAGGSIRAKIRACLEAGRAVVRRDGLARCAGCDDQRRARRGLLCSVRHRSAFLFLASDPGFAHRSQPVFQLARPADLD